MSTGPLRPVALEGALNFRDVGGYPTGEGSLMATGRLYRSDHLADLTDGDLDRLTQLDLQTVLDLRSDPELAARPSLLPATVNRRLHLPLGGPAAHQTDWVELMISGEMDGFGPSDMGEGYISLITEQGTTLAAVLTAVAEQPLPLLFHCTAGKDRTGVTAALIQLICGVERATVIDDYLLSNPLRAERRIAELSEHFAARGADIEPFRAFFSAPITAIEMLLGHLDERGGVRRCLIDDVGLDETTIDRIRDRLVG